jgi:mediator of RNA polymerase II transcription subunit 12, fungi type
MAERPPHVPSILHEVHGLANTVIPDAASTVANSLWIKYRTSQDWPIKAWENALSALQNVATSSTLDDVATGDIILRYSTFLVKVDQHLPDGLDRYILNWLSATGRNEMPFLQAPTWSLLEPIILYLVIHGSLSTTTVLSGLIYPACQLAASSSGSLDSTTLAYLVASCSLFHKLLLGKGSDEQVSTGSTFPRDLFDVQRLRTRRRTVYYEPHFSSLAGTVPLLIYIESAGLLPESLGAQFASLRRELCQDRRFRQGAYRNLDVIREAFETSPFLVDTSYESLRKDAVAGLRMILWDSVEGLFLQPCSLDAC